MKKKIGAIIILALVLLCITVHSLSKEFKDADTVGKGTESGQITKASVAKMVSMLVYEKEEIMDMERQIVYDDVAQDDWCAPYINAFYCMGITETDENDMMFEPQSYLTYGEAESILKQWTIQHAKGSGKESKQLYDSVVKKSGVLLEREKSGDYITKAEWNNLYETINEEWYQSVARKEQFYVLEVPADSGSSWNAVTDRGVYGFAGIACDTLVNHAVSAYIKEDEVLEIISVPEDAYTVKNVYITAVKEDSLSFVIQDCERECSCTAVTDNIQQGMVADIVLNNDRVESVTCHTGISKEKVLSFDGETIVLEKSGEYSWTEDVQVYKNNEEVRTLDEDAIVAGETDYVVVKNEENRICAVILEGHGIPRKIRVLLTTNNFASKYHKKIKISSDKAFVIRWGKGEKTYRARQVVTIKENDKRLEDGHMTVTSAKDAKLKVSSIKRNGKVPEYRGYMEISRSDYGLVLVNEVSIEEYLYAVLPSEMPSGYGNEALKAQAVCARSYAYRQLQSQTYSEYDAHLDDTTSYQVYNNIPETEESIRAVDETSGQVLSYDGNVISTYYFSTSCGHTSTAEEVWSGDEKQPYLTGDYLAKCQADKETLEKLDLTDEKDFRRFLRSDIKTYDSDAAWYRWKSDVTAAQLKTNIDICLEARYQANPDLILTKGEDGRFKSVPVGTIGDVKRIEILTRTDGGIITELLIEGSKETIKVYTEYNIRRILAPIHSTVIRQDKSHVQGLVMLPSAFFTVDASLEKDGLHFIFKGGGYGHGVGMSQTAVAAMADEGFDYRQMLLYFYKGSEIVFL